MYELPTIPRMPERPLDPPCRATVAHDWAAIFRCAIGDEGMPVKIIATVTRADEIDPDSIEAWLEPAESGHVHSINITGLLNAGHRADIAQYFERNYDEIFAYNHE